MIDFNNTFVICLGNLTMDEMVNLCINYDKENDWTYGLSREYLEKHAEDWYDCNEMLKTECPKYGIEYIDTSKDRENILKDILNRIN